MNFYFDDYNLISCDKAMDKVAVLKDETGNEEKLLFFLSQANFKMKIKLRNKYYIEYDGKTYLVKYRFITHTTRFNEENYYTGKLGYEYSKTSTTFYLWAPTAYFVNVIINDEKYAMQYQDKGVYTITINKNLENAKYYYEVSTDEVRKALDPYAISSTKDSGMNIVIDINKLNKVNYYQYLQNRPIIYETHISDFTYNSKYRNLFKGMRKDNEFIDHILNLGITHLQLLPIYDFGSVEEDYRKGEYNWGYDPVQYNVIEGKYCENPNDGYERINELIEVINFYHQHNIGINMDVVYNHVYNAETFSFNRIVPYYFFRYKNNELSNASFCGNEVASEQLMVRKFIVDSLTYLLKTFDFDGFRFDLVGILDYETCRLIEKTLVDIKPSIMLYGEGWLMPTAINPNLCAIQTNADKFERFGFFDDWFRNNCKKFAMFNNDENIEELFHTKEYPKAKQAIKYVSCHDDYCLYDYFKYELNADNILLKVKTCLFITLMSDGIAFLHAGSEFLRTKQGIKNTYKSSIEINRLDLDLINTNKELVDFVKKVIDLRKKYSEQFEVKYVDKIIELKFKQGIITYNVENGLLEESIC